MGTDEGPLKGERNLLRRLRERLQETGDLDPNLAVGFGDDMVSVPGDRALLWSTDMLMDGVDFDSGRHAWRQIGLKAINVNLSDCAAMASTPVAALCAVCLCDDLDGHAALELLEGVRDGGARFGCTLVGGDTNSWRHPTAISVSIASRVRQGAPPIRRDGARPGDAVYLSGRVGGSLAGRHLTFTPRVTLALDLARTVKPTAMIDISDGLAIDLWHICDASGCGAELQAEALDAMIHEDALRLAAQSGQTAREHALFDGEDFELLFTSRDVMGPDQAAKLGVCRIGTACDARDVTLCHADGRRASVPRRGWEHFR